MAKEHLTVLLEVKEGCFQALCLCGWISITSFKEEVDLIRAIHAHDAAVFFGRAS